MTVHRLTPAGTPPGDYDNPVGSFHSAARRREDREWTPLIPSLRITFADQHMDELDPSERFPVNTDLVVRGYEPFGSILPTKHFFEEEARLLERHDWKHVIRRRTRRHDGQVCWAFYGLPNADGPSQYAAAYPNPDPRG